MTPSDPLREQVAAASRELAAAGLVRATNGNVSAREKIEIKAKTEMFGDIKAPKLVIEEGVTFVGKSEVNPNKVAPVAPPPPVPGEAAKVAEPAKVGRF